jgi:ArsR family transcriptional regulator, arsenate/arsenite/antimonite-responsive transcriptional repressor
LTFGRIHFNYPTMIEIISRLSALSHEARLDVFQLLVRAGRDGLPAGEIAGRLEIPPTALSFHLNRLRVAGLIRQRRDGKQLIYTASFAAMRELIGFLSDNCCADDISGCGPECPPQARPHRRKPAARVVETEDS